MLGAQRLSEWAKQVAPGGGLSPSSTQKAFAFWEGKEGVAVPCVVGLRSAVEVAGLEVHMLTYNTNERIPGLPLGICVTSCEALLPRKVFDAALTKGVGKWFLAELILAKACAMESGWIIDCDCIWLRRAPGIREDGSDFEHGHFFGSKAACPQETACPQEVACPQDELVERAKWWTLNYLKKPRDELFLAKPFRLPRSSPWLAEYIAWAMELVESRNPEPIDMAGWRKTLTTMIHRWGLADACAAPSTCNALAGCTLMLRDQ